MLYFLYYLYMYYFYWREEYSFLVCYFFLIACFLGFLWFIVLNCNFSFHFFEKTSQYECGFEPFGFNSIFDLQYFIIGLLYLIFDAELVLILPWLLGVSSLSFGGFCSMFLFLLFFVVGLIFEWKKNVLHWT
jgi:NADH:ubiquinone oxidoreductase subunit 3 (subunit A)